MKVNMKITLEVKDLQHSELKLQDFKFDIQLDSENSPEEQVEYIKSVGGKLMEIINPTVKKEVLR